MAISDRIKTILVLLLSGFSVYLGVSNLADRISWRQADDGVQWAQTRDGVVVVKPPQGEDIGELDLEPGDLLVSVQGIPVGGLDELTEIHDFLARSMPPGSPAEYEVRRGADAPFTVMLQVGLGSTITPIDFLLAAAAFGFLLIGLTIFLRHWGAAGAFHFYLLCLVAFILLLFRHSGRSDAFDVSIYWFNSVAFLLLPALFLHFCLCFPQPARPLQGRPLLKFLLYAPFAALTGLHAAWFLGELAPIGLVRNEVVSRRLDQFYLLYFTLFFLLGAYSLLRAARKDAPTIQRQQIKWVAYGTAAGLLPFAFFYALPFSLGWSTGLASQASVLSLVLIPLSFGYAVTRYRLMDVDVIFKKSVAYLLASSALIAAYVAIVVFIGRALRDLWSDSEPLLWSLGALLVAFAFAPLKERIQAQIDRSFYKDRYGYRQSFADFGKSLNAEINLPQLIGMVSSRLEATLDARSAAVFLREDPNKPVYELYDDGELLDGGSPLRLELEDKELRRLCRESSDLFPEADSHRVNECRASLRSLGLHYFEPLQAHERLIGFLGLGKRADGRLLSSEDLQLVGALAGYASIAIDNARLYQSLEANAAQLAELKAYSDNVIECITVGVVVASPEGEITTWNATMETLYEMSREEALGKNLREVFPESLIGSLEPFLSGPRWDLMETRRLHKTHLRTHRGQTRMVQVTLAPFVSTSSLSAGTLLIFDDVTEKTRLESQLLQAEKLSSIGLFAAGIAHEVNTPLTGISSYVQMLIKETAKDDPRLDVLKRIEQQTFRASDIVNNLLNFARVQDTDFQEINLNSLVAETVSLLEHPMRKARVEVQMDLDASLPSTVGNGGKLQQVFMNLFLNARDAMPEGGDLRIATRYRESMLVVEVEDSGQGISKDHIKKIYDPFFTTKEVGKGTGLGLSVSYGIIQEHSGRISVDSRPGRGTVFTLELPVKRVH